MDHEDALRQRRAALKRRIRRRRLAALATLCGLLVVIAVVSGVLGGSDREHGPAATSPAANTAPPGPSRARTVARTAAQPLPGAHRAPHESVPILMYHVVGERKAGTPNPTLWVAPRDFRSHVQALRRAGYNGVTLQQVWDAWHHDGRLPRRPVVLSFDDGYYGQVSNAMPALKRVGWPGVLNLKLGNLADMGGRASIRRMIDAGWEIDSHTFTHPDLTTLPGEALRHELAGSRKRLRALFGVRANFLCYPAGRYDDAVIAAVKGAGYLAATTTELGWARPAGDRFALSRVRVDGGMSAGALMQRMRGARSS